MTHPIPEPLSDQISAFIDGELPERELDLLFKRLEREPELRNTAVRYAAIGESLRASAHGGVSRGFADRVCEAVARDSIGLEAAFGKGGSSRVRWLRKAGGLAAGVAIAATVAGLAILILQQQTAAPGASQTPLQAANTTAAGTVVIGEIGNGEAPSYTVTLPATTSPLLPAARLTDYVIAHSEYSSPLGRRNMLSGAIAADPAPVEVSETVSTTVVQP